MVESRTAFDLKPRAPLDNLTLAQDHGAAGLVTHDSTEGASTSSFHVMDSATMGSRYALQIVHRSTGFLSKVTP